MKKKKKSSPKYRYVHAFASNDGKTLFPISINHELKNLPIFIDVRDFAFAQIVIQKGNKMKEPDLNYDDE